ncbi:peptidoglycan-recognition protein [Plakobranchus ocellatus]|uniref:Peptidoglycan-recognition protein n=1 Tax=Plakobranchus ocellatus TaxID=259542 RepID=A0AAV4DIX7_9GAST|nr:peptidoglycan-recognition protein [Plakobranchus ocellatus]
MNILSIILTTFVLSCNVYIQAVPLKQLNEMDEVLIQKSSPHQGMRNSRPTMENVLFERDLLANALLTFPLLKNAMISGAASSVPMAVKSGLDLDKTSVNQPLTPGFRADTSGWSKSTVSKNRRLTFGLPDIQSEENMETISKKQRVTSLSPDVTLEQKIETTEENMETTSEKQRVTSLSPDITLEQKLETIEENMETTSEKQRVTSSSPDFTLEQKMEATNVNQRPAPFLSYALRQKVVASALLDKSRRVRVKRAHVCDFYDIRCLIPNGKKYT